MFRGHDASAELAAIQAELARAARPGADGRIPTFALVCRKLRVLAEAGEEVLLTGETGVGKEVYAKAIHRASGRDGAVRGRQLRGHPARAGRDRAVRLRARRALAGGDGQARDHRGGGGRDAVPRRDRRDGARAADQAAALHAGPDAGAGRRACTRGGSRRASSRRPAARRRRRSRGAGCAPIWRSASAPSRSASRRCASGSRTWARSRPTCSASEGKPFELAAFQSLCLYTWPGNVRELGKAMTSAEALARGAERIDYRAPARGRSRRRRASGRRRGGASRGRRPTAAELEALMRRFRGNMMRVARELDRKPALVYRWAKRFGLERGRLSAPERDGFECARTVSVCGDETRTGLARRDVAKWTTWRVSSDPRAAASHTVSTGRARAGGAAARALRRARRATRFSAKWAAALASVGRARVAILGIPSDCGAGLARGAAFGPEGVRRALLRLAPGLPGARARAPGSSTSATCSPCRSC